uniref:Uncharacterized protein n=1 Tax=Parascaris univalens TaxID=6257 RepID=A0A915BC06_PARUN
MAVLLIGCSKFVETSESHHRVIFEMVGMSFVPKILNGGFAGIVGMSCVFPIDLVKTRLQNQRVSHMGKPQYSGIVDCARQTWRSGGTSLISKIHGMYRGCSVNLLLITPEKAIKLVANDFFRFELSVPGQEQLPVWRSMIAGAGAGLLTTNERKITAIGLTVNLLRSKGIAGLYKGVGPTMARDVTFSTIYFPLFAYLEALGPRSTDGSGDAVFYASFIAGLTAAAFASFAVTPLDGVEIVLLKLSYIRLTNWKILKQEGVKALFKGAACRMMVMAPLFGIAQMVYYIGVAEFCLGIPKVHH